MANTVTITHPNVDSAFASGTITCDGTIVYVSCGFQPSYVKLVNTTTIEVIEWWAGMTAENYLDVITSAGTTSYATSGGPAVFAGDSDESSGFSIPAALTADAEVIKWIAFR